MYINTFQIAVMLLYMHVTSTACSKVLTKNWKTIISLTGNDNYFESHGFRVSCLNY